MNAENPKDKPILGPNNLVAAANGEGYPWRELFATGKESFIMGLTLGPAYDKKFAGADSFSKFTDGKDLVDAMEIFDQICNEKNVTLFSTFAPDCDALVEELGPGETLEDAWFDCDDGLHTICTLIEALQTEKKWSKGKRKNEIPSLVASLQELEKDLKTAKKNKARFYLLVC